MFGMFGMFGMLRCMPPYLLRETLGFSGTLKVS